MKKIIQKSIYMLVLSLLISLIYLMEVTLIYLLVMAVYNLGNDMAIIVALFGGTVSSMVSIATIKATEIKTLET